MRHITPQGLARRRAEYELWLTDYMRRNPVIEPVRIVEAAFSAGWSAGQRKLRTPEELEAAKARALRLEDGGGANPG